MASNAKATIQPRGKGKTNEPERQIVQVFFRAPAEIVEKADQVAKSRTIPSTRQNWILEAMVEKLEREGCAI